MFSIPFQHTILYCVRIFFCVAALGSAPLFVYAETFLTQTIVGADTTPPTIPADVVAVPITANQIDVTWSASTDDWLLEGYRVWRDDVLLATTTATTYSDTGLTASTTYRYYITAFDSFNNESASSTEVSTTTLAIAVPPAVEETRTTFGTKVTLPNEILSLEISADQYAVTIRYVTRNHIRSVVRYGESIAYELGSVRGQSFLKVHETRLTGLVPGTAYLFSISGDFGNGRYGTMYTGSFMTLPATDVFSPSNVTNLKAVERGNGILVSWDNPRESDFDRVVVVRNNRFFPSDPSDGWLVYEGRGTSAFDDANLENDDWFYYSVFAYDKNGNISSGAVTSLYSGDGEDIPLETATSTRSIDLTYFDIEFFQEGERILGDAGQITVDGSKSLLVSIPYDAVPEHLKTILFEIRDRNNPEKRARFLLRVDEAFTAYTTTLAPFSMPGVFDVTVIVYDLKTQDIGSVTGVINAYLDPRSGSENQGSSEQSTLRISYLVLFLSIFIVLILVGRRLLRVSW